MVVVRKYIAVDIKYKEGERGGEERVLETLQSMLVDVSTILNC